MNNLGNGLSIAKHHEDALSVQEAKLAMLRRLGATKSNILSLQGNLANTYQELGRLVESLHLRREVYLGYVNFRGEEHEEALKSANNYASTISCLGRFEEAKPLLRKTIPVARRVLGENDQLTPQMRSLCARALYEDTGATVDDLREAVNTLEEIEATARRVLGGSHPMTVRTQEILKLAQKKLASFG